MNKDTALKLSEYEETILNTKTSSTTFFNNGKTTIVILTMNNGFDVVGKSSCVHRDSFDASIGRHFALVDAIREVEKFIGFGRQQESYERKQNSNLETKEEVNYEGLEIITDTLLEIGKTTKDNAKLIAQYIKQASFEIKVSETNSPKDFIKGGMVGEEHLITMDKGETICTNSQARENVRLINDAPNNPDRLGACYGGIKQLGNMVIKSKEKIGVED